MTRLLALLAAALLVPFLGCGGSTTPIGDTTPDLDSVEPQPEALPDEETPIGQLPADVAPTHYTLALSIVPSRDRFAGVADIDVRLERRRDVIWLHGKDLHVTAATVTPAGGAAIEASWEIVHAEDGVTRLRLAQPIEPGEARIHVEYDAPFDRQLTGLYRVDTGGDSYAFTQFEATSARRAFPSFDEPRFKVPFDITLTGQADHEIAGNTLPVDEQAAGEGMKRIRFATTPPLPTYLIAWAVGPLDVVAVDPVPASELRERPIPLRGLAVKGKGEQLRYALEHTPRHVAWLEEYFGMAYPYDKLDIVAVPDFAAGAMENVGLITFREHLLLVDPETATEDQKRGFAYVMAHELAHMWFGNIVTMPWWDDIWLNEAFATWMGNKVVEHLYPEYQAPVSQLMSVQRAMRSDSLTSARQIRQPVENSHDIRNAFDTITYSKGGGVLEMFERWMGEEAFHRGVQQHMDRHRFGVANFEDLLESLDAVTDKPLVAPFRSFLFQPGVPFVEMRLVCEGDSRKLTLEQSRYLPVGSPGQAEQTWQIPICVRYEAGGEVKSQCTLLTEHEGLLELESETCPTWVMPNDDAAGYFRFALDPEAMEALQRRGWRHLTAREKLAVADSVRAGFDNASLAAADVYGSLDVFAESDVRPVATTPTGLVEFAVEYVLAGEPPEGAPADLAARAQRYGQRLYRTHYRRLGWGPRGRRVEDGETSLLREDVLGFLAFTVEDAAVRRQGARLGQAYVRGGEIHPDAVEPNVAGLALTLAVQEGDSALFDQLTEMLFESTDATVRTRILRALGGAKDPTMAARARALSLDARLRVNEVMTPLWAQVEVEESRDALWEWLVDNFDALRARVGPHSVGYTPWMSAGFCDEAHATAVDEFFRPRIEDLPGGPRNLAGALEAIRLCAARVEAHRESTTAFFTRQR